MQTAYLSMVASLDPDAVSHLVVQRMAAPGVACVVRSVEDALFGPVVSFGLAGVVPELLGDRAYAIPPLTDVEAERRPDASQRGVIVDNIILTSSDCGKQVLFKLQGTRVAPTITSSVNELAFGKINSCASDPLPSRSVVLTNAWSQPAQLRYVLPSGFTFTAQPSSIPAGGSAAPPIGSCSWTSPIPTTTGA